MFILVLLSLTAVVAAEYQGGNSYGVPENNENSISYGTEYNDYGKEHEKHSHHKLRTLHQSGIVKAKIRYYEHKDNTYAVISCLPRPNSRAMILVASHRTIPVNGPSNTVAIAGGDNVQVIAKARRHNKFEAEDAFELKKHQFKKVGCYYQSKTTFDE